MDVNYPGPMPPYNSLATAAYDIQTAVDAANNGDLILVNDGYYSTRTHATKQSLTGIGTTLYDTNRIAITKPVTVQSIDGPAAACIDGGGQYRCAFVTNGAVLRGFTLHNGLVGWLTTTVFLGHSTTKTNTGYHDRSQTTFCIITESGRPAPALTHPATTAEFVTFAFSLVAIPCRVLNSTLLPMRPPLKPKIPHRFSHPTRAHPPRISPRFYPTHRLKLLSLFPRGFFPERKLKTTAFGKGHQMQIWRTKLRGSEFKVTRFNDTLPSGTALDNPKRLVAYLRPRLAESLIYRPDVENFIVVHLSTRRNAIGFEIISTGTLDTLLVHAREVFKAAI